LGGLLTLAKRFWKEYDRVVCVLKGVSALFADRLFVEVIMRRHSVHKGRSARKFRLQVGRTKVANMRGPMRGGFRF